MFTYHVETRKPHRKYKDRFGSFEDKTIAQAWYNGINNFNGVNKRLVRRHPDGTVKVLHRNFG